MISIYFNLLTKLHGKEKSLQIVFHLHSSLKLMGSPREHGNLK